MSPREAHSLESTRVWQKKDVQAAEEEQLSARFRNTQSALTAAAILAEAPQRESLQLPEVMSELASIKQTAASQAGMITKLLQTAHAEQMFQAQHERELRSLVEDLRGELRAEREHRLAVESQLTEFKWKLEEAVTGAFAAQAGTEELAPHNASADARRAYIDEELRTAAKMATGLSQGAVSCCEEFGAELRKERSERLAAVEGLSQALAELKTQVQQSEAAASHSSSAGQIDQERLNELRMALEKQGLEHATGIRELAEMFSDELSGLRASSDEQCRLLLQEVQGEREERRGEIARLREGNYLLASGRA
jgi:hypothetical protein